MPPEESSHLSSHSSNKIKLEQLEKELLNKNELLKDRLSKLSTLKKGLIELLRKNNGQYSLKHLPLKKRIKY